MVMLRFWNMVRTPLTLLLLIVLMGACGKNDVPFPPNQAGAQLNCTPQTATIYLWDNALESGCGCQEAAGTRAFSGTRFQCTITAGTTVFFNMLGPSLRHQIIASGNPSFPSSAPSQKGKKIIHAHQFDSPGTYSFLDQYNHTLTGQIVVQ